MEERHDVIETGPGGQRRVVTHETTAPVDIDEQRVTSYDPYAARRNTAYRLVQLVWLVAGIVLALLAFRFVLRLLGANPNADFAVLVYNVTAPLLAPFAGLFATPQAAGSALELHTLIAMLVYLLLAWLIARLVWLLAGETRAAVETSASTVERRID